MTNAKPATRTVPLRAAPVLVSTNSSAVPPPVPLPRTTRTHEASLAAVHAHPATADTPTVTVPPLAATSAAPVLSFEPTRRSILRHRDARVVDEDRGGPASRDGVLRHRDGDDAFTLAGVW